MRHKLLLIAVAGLPTWPVVAPAAGPAPGGMRPAGATPMPPPVGIASLPARPAPPAAQARPALAFTGIPAGSDLHGPLCAALARLPERLGDRPALPADVGRLLGTLGADCPALPRRASAADTPADLDD